MSKLTDPKVCIGCKLLLPPSNFGLAVKADGSVRLESRCFDCRRIYRIKNAEKHNANRRDALHMLAPGEYDSKLKQQNNVCAVCGLSNPDGKSLANDHDHQTGRNRGLLCSKCNLILGQHKDNTEIFRQFADYLDKHR